MGEFYDASEVDVTVAAERNLVWMAFPRQVLVDRRDDRGAAFSFADSDVAGRDPQNEYCEWHVTRNAAGKITKVVFVTESPEYWERLWADERATVVSLYQTLVSPAVVEADLPVGGPGSAYNKFNPWNTTGGIVHLIQSINTLSAALGLAQGSIHTVTARDNYETMPPGLRTSVDPRVKFDIGALARKPLSITLREPIGLYMTGYDEPGGQNRMAHQWKLLAHRARFTRTDLAARVSGAARGGVRCRRYPDRRPAHRMGRADRRTRDGNNRRHGRSERTMKAKKRTKRVVTTKAGRDRADTLKPLEIAIDSPALTTKFSGVLHQLGKFEPKLPKHILIPALAGDPGAEIPGAEPEPVYGLKARANIQGNTIPGFNKDHQHFLFFRLGNIRRAKSWLRWIAPFISSMEEVLAWVRAFRAMRLRLALNRRCARRGSISRSPAARLSCWQARPMRRPSAIRVSDRAWPRAPPTWAIRRGVRSLAIGVNGSWVVRRTKRTFW